MHTRRTNPLALVTLCGAACCAIAAEPNTIPPHRTRRALPVGHIYYNPASGERVITPLDARPRNTTVPVWVNNNTDPCATGGTVGIIDDPMDPDDLVPCTGGTYPCEGSWYVWWGDIEFNTPIYCVVTAYAIDAPDLDLDSDSIGDGIVGYDLSLTFSDNDNGFGASARSCIIDLTFPTIPGRVGELPPGFMAVYILTIDLLGSAPSLIFELGDSDGEDNAGTGFSGAAIYGHPTGADLDSDALHDFSYAIRFDQTALPINGPPGASKGDNGFVAVADFLGNPGDTSPASPAQGLFDACDIYSSGPSCPGSTSTHLGTFFFGGFTCAQPSPVPYASAYLELYSGVIDNFCQANFDGGPLPADFTDVLTFLVDFSGACTDGIGNFDFSSGGAPNNCDFTDVLAFLTSFASANCGN